MTDPKRFADEPISAHGVVLRPLRESDVAKVAEACSDPVIQQWLPLPRPYTEESARFFVFDHAAKQLESGDGLERAITIDGEFAGVIGFKGTDWTVGTTEAGYWVAPWARGRGAAARALSAITDWALDTQGMGRVEARVAPGNEASLRSVRKALFVEEGTLRRSGHVHDGMVDLVMFSRLVSDPRPTFETLHQ